MKVEELNLSNRTYNAIKRKGIATVEELSQMTEGEIKSIRNLGFKSYLELINALESYGYQISSNKVHE